MVDFETAIRSVVILYCRFDFTNGVLGGLFIGVGVILGGFEGRITMQECLSAGRPIF
jgi:hypothetical protein